VRYLTPTQLSILYRVIKKDARMSALVRLLHTSGARIAEVLALNLDDIDSTLGNFRLLGKATSNGGVFTVR